uniref:Uncharacterized protein n=1 Tax=Cajanus cajan TaxID=3821 RepID=A0A151TVR9_CAJCA|nr:hypothetical protein KK1_010345 [Cajanus cajan]
MRFCPLIRTIWYVLLSRQQHSWFFDKVLSSWLLTNLSEHSSINNRQWNILFAVAIDVFWRCRNKFVFQDI